MKNPMRVFQVNSFTVGAIAANTAQISTTKIDATRLQGSVPRDIDFQLDYTGKTTGDGPLIVGLCSGLAIAEIAEFFSADPQRMKDPSEAEESQRAIMVLGVLGRHRTAALETPWLSRKWPGWWVREGVDLNAFVMNVDGSGFTSGTLVSLTTHIRGDWLND